MPRECERCGKIHAPKWDYEKGKWLCPDEWDKPPIVVFVGGKKILLHDLGPEMNEQFAKFYKKNLQH